MSNSNHYAHGAFHAAEHLLKHSDAGRQVTAAAVGGTILASKATLLGVAAVAPVLAPVAIAAGIAYGVKKLCEQY